MTPSVNVYIFKLLFVNVYPKRNEAIYMRSLIAFIKLNDYTSIIQERACKSGGIFFKGDYR